jgi:ribosomal protein L11 methyltransferase
MQVSVRAEPAALDAVANFLIERGSPGVVIKENQVQGYYTEGAEARAARRDLRHFLHDIKRIYPGVAKDGISWRRVKDRNWNQAWQRFFTPQRIGKSFLVCPPWLKPPALRGRHLISIEPGLAFGTGTHATTRGCMEFIERGVELQDCRPWVALDVGTGSGILAIAFAKLGARHVWAIDNDPSALEVARDNLRANYVSQAVRLSNTDVRRLRRRFAIVAANLTAETLVQLADALTKRVAPRGFLVLSGILRQHAEAVACSFKIRGFTVLQRKREKEWVTLLCRRSRGDFGGRSPRFNSSKVQ